jgi:hypothetical protein
MPGPASSATASDQVLPPPPSALRISRALYSSRLAVAVYW